LQLAVLELELPPEMRSHLQEVRRQGTGFKNLVHRFQSYRQRFQSEPHAVELNQVVKEALAESARLPLAGRGLAQLADAIEFVPAPGRLPLFLIESDLKRLILLLLFCLRGGMNGTGLTVRTEAATGGVRVRMEASGPEANRAEGLAAQVGALE